IYIIRKIDGRKMRNPKQNFNNEDLSNFQQALRVISNMNIKIYDKSCQTVSYIRQKVAKLRKQYPNEKILVLIDYLQLMRTDKMYESKNIEVGEITRSLKDMARDFRVPVYLLS